MGKRILKIIMSLKIPQYLLLALFLQIIQTPILQIILLKPDFIFYNETYNKLLTFVLSAFCLGIWIYLYSFVILDILYSRKTNGRSYTDDRKKYRRSYREMSNYFKDADPHRLSIDQFPEQEWRNSSGIIFGKSGKKLIRLDSNSEANIAVFGAPGSRKTSGVAIPTAAVFKGCVLAVDIKGDIYNFNKNHRNILRFCPDVSDPLRYSCHFNPFKGIHDMTVTERKIYIENMANILIPDEGGENGNYFTSRARKFFQGITHYMLYINPDATFPDVIHAILHPGMIPGLPQNPFDWVIKILETDCNAAKEQIGSFYGNNEKNVSGAFDCLCTALVPLSNDVLDVLLDGKGTCISMAALDAGYDCYLQIKQENLDAYAPIFTLIIQSLMTEFTSRPDTSTGAKNRPILMLLDECPQLTFSFKQLNSSLSTLRSKSIICMLIAQSKAQLEQKYGDTGARSLLGNCTYQLILSCIDGPSQQYFSRLIGTKKVLKVSTSVDSQKSTSRSVQEVREPVFQPEDFGDLKNNLVIYFNGKYVFAEKISCYAP